MTRTYFYTVGLEVHAELKTQTKMFCDCKNNPDEKVPNTNICPVCMAHPGALPVINKKAIENVIKVGLAVNGKIADFSEFDRKNYFYPDIPKGYQISQYKYPIVSGGHLADFDITRVHLEEDTANNKHFEGDPEGKQASYGAGFSLIDFNRAGVPLMELVTEPHTFGSVEETAKAATDFAKEFQLLLKYLDVSEANMEKGEMRVEANISASRDQKVFGTKVEVKNLNSFRSVERAIKYELERMTELLESGDGFKIVQETRGWDESKQSTYSQRKKEGSADYRYFPDPDLPKLKLHEAFDLEQMKKDLPELPEAKRARYKKDFGIKDEDIEVFVNNIELASNFEKTTDEIIKEKVDKEFKIKVADNLYISSVIGIMKENKEAHYPEPRELTHLSGIIVQGGINSTSAKEVLNDLMTTKNKSALEIIKERKLEQINDEGAIKAIVEKIISENPEVVATYKSGKENAIMSLVGKVIKESKGSANPQLVIEMLKKMLARP